MAEELDKALAKLTEIQQRAVEWQEGPLLVLAGPGSGKTQVLTCRIARLLDQTKDEKFRILALTFTNKAADEMKSRVAAFVPGLEERANIGTFHGFCAQILRQHGVHIGINPDFAIYSTDDDREKVLKDALTRAQHNGKIASRDDTKYLSLIDRLKARLIEPKDAESVLTRFDEHARIAAIYQLYEEELRRSNALDFNSLIFEAYRLIRTFPAIAGRYRKSHPYWLIDEFQDTTKAQYNFVRVLAGNSFHNVFAVADDDQIIYAWNGASYRQIQSLLSDFSAELIQLPTNYRCPPAIVEAANQLVAYNAQRTDSKKPLLAGKTEWKYPVSEHIQLRTFATDEEEATEIAREIASHGNSLWGATTVLARSRALLEGINNELQKCHVPSVIAQRRDDFLSAEFRWLVAVARQLISPLDRRNFDIVVESFNRLAGLELSPEQVVIDAETTGGSYLSTWLSSAGDCDLNEDHQRALLTALGPALNNIAEAKRSIELIVTTLGKDSEEQRDSDLSEDMTAWRELTRDIASHIGKSAPLEQFLQELQLRSKEPTPKPNTVTLMTIHGSKGREFDFVYVIGLAEDVMPSYQSKKKGDQSPEMEEERRNCFVAITRTKECLVLSRAARYRGWPKEPSRFLLEMKLVNDSTP